MPPPVLVQNTRVSDAVKARSFKSYREVLLVPRWVKTKRATFKYGLGDPDPGLFISTYIGYWFIGIAMIAIGMVASFPFVVAAKKDFPADNLKEFIAYVKAAPEHHYPNTAEGRAQYLADAEEAGLQRDQHLRADPVGAQDQCGTPHPVGNAHHAAESARSRC